MALFVLEAKVQGFGILGLGGIVAAVIGCLILIDVGWDHELRLPVDRGALATATPPFPGPVSATADDRGARVEFGPRTIADVGKGLALAVFNADGTLWRTLEFPSDSPLRVEPEAAIYEFKAESPCVEITTDQWTDIAPVLATGSWLAT